MTSALGTCMAECAPAILAEIKSLLVPGKLFRYCEIGTYQGTTLLGIAEFLRANHGNNWLAIGVDVPGWDTTSLAATTFTDFSGNVILSDEGSPKIFRHPEWKDGIDFCLIDGCHGYDCVRADFLAVEPFIRKGGSVCFHDTAKSFQGTSHQPHCKEKARVREAVHVLGLLPGKRWGWKTKAVVEEGTGAMLFTKTI